MWDFSARAIFLWNEAQLPPLNQMGQVPWTYMLDVHLVYAADVRTLQNVAMHPTTTLYNYSIATSPSL